MTIWVMTSMSVSCSWDRWSFAWGYFQSYDTPQGSSELGSSLRYRNLCCGLQSKPILRRLFLWSHCQHCLRPAAHLLHMQGRAIRLLLTAATSTLKDPMSTYLISHMESVARTTIVVVAARVQEKYNRTEVWSSRYLTVKLLSS